MAGVAEVRRPRLAADDRRLPARPRRAVGPPRPDRGRARAARERLAVDARRSPGCAACAGSTRSRHSGCAPRSAQFDRFEHPDQLAAYLGIVPSRTPPASSAARARSPRPAPPTPAGCWSRPPTTTSVTPAVGQTLERRQRAQPARDHQHRLARAAAAARPLAPAQARSRQAQRHRRGRDRPRARRLLLGDRHHAD